MALLWIIGAFLSAAAGAAGPSVKDLQGKAAFDWTDAKSPPCRVVNQKLAAKMAQGKCVANTTNFGGDDKPAAFRCEVKKAEYLVFERMEDCRVARENARANQG